MINNRLTALYFVIVSILIILFAIPLVMELIPPNKFYGIEPDQGLDDEYYWYLQNKTAGIGLVAGGVASFVFSIILVAKSAKFTKRQIYIRGLSYLALGITLALIISKFIISII